ALHAAKGWAERTMPMSGIEPALIERLRSDSLLSRSDLAQHLGVDPSTIARWETGKAAPTGTAALVLRAATAKYRGPGEEVVAFGALAVPNPLLAAAGLFGLLKKTFDDAGVGQGSHSHREERNSE
ncbi:MAG: helix-turn-helix transcriptional regulator, partial [Myxococcales bacterium]|nr:helix-turn-helix transcriptional regulator [Myxococcales bacterium]